MDNTQRFKVFNLDNNEMFRAVRGMYGDAIKANHYISMQQNDYKERALEIYAKWYKRFKRAHYFELWCGNINQMDLEEDAHRFGFSMTISTISEFEDIDRAILEQNMTVVTDSPTNYLSAIIDVLGKENHEPDTPQNVKLTPELIKKLLDLHDFLKKRGNFNDHPPE